MRMNKFFSFPVWMFFTALMIAALPQAARAQTVKQIPVTIDAKDDVGKTIQAALDQALTDQSGETVFEVILPKGEYHLNRLLKVSSYTTIKMDGCTLIRENNATMLRMGYETEAHSGYEGKQDITIEGGCFDGNGAAKEISDSLVRMGHGKNLTFRNVTFKNVYNSHHLEFAACENILIDGCTFKDFTSSKDVVNSANNEALQFDIIHNEEHFPKYPAFDDTPCRNVTVTNCVFDNLQRGLGTHSAVAGSYFTNMSFTNNTFTNVKGYAIIATNYKGSVISGNTITGCGAGILFRSMIQGYNNFYAPLSNNPAIVNNADSVIENNTIRVADYKYKTTAYGISLYGEVLSAKKKEAPKGDYTLKGVTVRNNSITMNNCGYGIWLQTTDDSIVENNTVIMDIKSSVSGKGNADCIRLVKSKNDTIANNTLQQKKNNKKTGKACGIVLATKSDATLKSNKITNSPKDGIYLYAKSKGNLTGNTIKKTGRHGVNVVEKSVATMKGNKISKYKAKLTNTYAGGKIKKK